MLAPKQFDPVNRDLEIRDLYNMEDAFHLGACYQQAYRARLNANLVFWDSLDGRTDWPADANGGHPLTDLLLADFLVVDLTKPYSEHGSFLEIENGKIYYEECGSGSQTVVLVHDGVLDSAVWNDVWPAFCKSFHTIRYDRRGYGRSPAATEGHFATDDLASLLRHLKVNHAAIVGSSHGGEISINFALAHPELVQQLVLVGAVVGGMPYSQHFLDRGSVLGRPLEKGDVQGAIAAAVKDKYLIAPGRDAAKKRMAELLSQSQTSRKQSAVP